MMGPSYQDKEYRPLHEESNREWVGRQRLVRRIEKRDKRIEGLKRKIAQLESALACRTLDLESLSRNLRCEVQSALCNVRMIPVFGGTRDRVITEVRSIPVSRVGEAKTVDPEP